MYRLTKLDVTSVAKIYAVLGAAGGLLLGIVTALAGQGVGTIAILAFPVMYAIGGLIAGAIGAWLFNVVAEKIGGIGMKLEK